MTKKEMQDFIIKNYHYKKQDLNGLLARELKEIIQKETDKREIIKNNPNSFWVIKELPTPELDNEKSRKSYAWLILGIYISLFLLFGIMIWVGLIYLQ